MGMGASCHPEWGECEAMYSTMTEKRNYIKMTEGGFMRPAQTR
jgi:hypothetical protein